MNTRYPFKSQPVFNYEFALEEITNIVKLKKNNERLKISMILSMVFQILLFLFLIVMFLAPYWDPSLNTTTKFSLHFDNLNVALAEILVTLILVNIAFGIWSLVEGIFLTVATLKLKWKEDYLGLIIASWVLWFMFSFIGCIFWIVVSVKLLKSYNNYSKQLQEYTINYEISK